MSLPRLPSATVLAFLALLLPTGCAQDELPDDPPMREALTNLDVEQGGLGSAPDGWFLSRWSRERGYRIELTGDDPYSGRRAVLVDGRNARAEGLGTLLQWVDATPYRGKRVRFSAALRSEVSGPDNKGRLWFRVDDDNSILAQPPIVDEEWRRYEVVADVASDAGSVKFGAFLQGSGKLWFDDASVEILGDLGMGDEPARSLSEAGLQNLVALTRLLGYVRYFHPSDEAAATDWERFAVDAVNPVERATSPGELAEVLQTVFGPVAPTVRIHESGRLPELPDGLRAPPAGARPEPVRWLHYGVGIDTFPYVSHRTHTGTDVPERLADVDTGAPETPDEVFRTELGAGVAVALPISLYATEAGTHPAGSGRRLVGDRRPDGWAPSGDDRSTRLAAVMLGWNVFRHFYPYFDVVSTDWDGALEDALHEAAESEDACAFLEIVRDMVARLQDGHGRAHHPCDATRGGLGVLWEWIEGRLVITAFDAERAPGVVTGDEVLSIDGENPGTLLDAIESRISGATPQWIRHRALAELRAGPPESKTVLQLRGPGGATREVTLTRNAGLNGPEVLRETRPEPVDRLPGGVAYVDMGRVTEDQWSDALRDIADAPGVILDLRGYPTQSAWEIIPHLIDEPVTSARWLIPVVTHPDRTLRFDESNWTLQPKSPRFRGKTVFLTDGRAISAAETLMGIVEHYRLAEIVGAPTAGTNGNINSFTLPGGYSITWTGMKVLKHDGSRHHGVGILPTVPVARSLAGVAAGRDEVLERGIELAVGG